MLAWEVIFILRGIKLWYQNRGIKLWMLSDCIFLYLYVHELFVVWGEMCESKLHFLSQSNEKNVKSRPRVPLSSVNTYLDYIVWLNKRLKMMLRIAFFRIWLLLKQNNLVTFTCDEAKKQKNFYMRCLRRRKSLNWKFKIWHYVTKVAF